MMLGSRTRRSRCSSSGSLVRVVMLAGALSGCGAPASPELQPEGAMSTSPAASAASLHSEPSAAVATTAQGEAPIAPGEFDSTDLVVGTGTLAEFGSRVAVHYVGKLLDGTTFDETGHRPFEFTLGQGEVIRGWDRGVTHMRVGGKRRLVVPPDLAYGARGSPPRIPPNATLVFEIELLDVR
jgi:FKBP-type peptidyl-prolyl cis-trans isomerase